MGAATRSVATPAGSTSPITTSLPVRRLLPLGVSAAGSSRTSANGAEAALRSTATMTCRVWLSARRGRGVRRRSSTGTGRRGRDVDDRPRRSSAAGATGTAQRRDLGDEVPATPRQRSERATSAPVPRQQQRPAPAGPGPRAARRRSNADAQLAVPACHVVDGSAWSPSGTGAARKARAVDRQSDSPGRAVDCCADACTIAAPADSTVATAARCTDSSRSSGTGTIAVKVGLRAEDGRSARATPGSSPRWRPPAGRRPAGCDPVRWIRATPRPRPSHAPRRAVRPLAQAAVAPTSAGVGQIFITLSDATVACTPAAQQQVSPRRRRTAAKPSRAAVVWLDPTGPHQVCRPGRGSSTTPGRPGRSSQVEASGCHRAAVGDSAKQSRPPSAPGTDRCHQVAAGRAGPQRSDRPPPRPRGSAPCAAHLCR